MTERESDIVQGKLPDVDFEELSSNILITLPDKVYFRIGEVADLLNVVPSIIRYWETEFKILKPDRSCSGQRLYRKKDIEMLALIREYLHELHFTIEGAKKQLAKRKNGSLSPPALPTTPSLPNFNAVISGLQEIKTLLDKP